MNFRTYSPYICKSHNLRDIHWLIEKSRILDFLDGGIASSARVDGLGKGIAEFLRSRVVNIPTRFLNRGLISST